MQLMLRANSVHHPVTLDMVKAHLRLDGDDEDEVLNRLIAVSTEMAERYLGLTLIEKTWSWTVKPDASGEILTPLPMGPLIEIVSVHQLMHSGKRALYRRYRMDYEGPKPMLRCTSHVPVDIVYRSGFGQIPQHIPATLIQGIIMLVAYFYTDREADRTIPDAIKGILSGFKMHFI